MSFTLFSSVAEILLILSDEGYPVLCLPVSLDEVNGVIFLLVLFRFTDSGYSLSASVALDVLLYGVAFSFL